MEFKPQNIMDEPETDPGQILGDPKRVRQDAMTVNRAIREGWDLSREEKDRIKGKVIDTLLGAKKDREVVRLAASLREMDKADVEAGRAGAETTTDQRPVVIQQIIGGKDQSRLGRGELMPGLPVPNAFAEEEVDAHGADGR